MIYLIAILAALIFGGLVVVAIGLNKALMDVNKEE